MHLLRIRSIVLTIVVHLYAIALPAFPQSSPYPWLTSYRQSHAIASRIKPPRGYYAVRTRAGTFEDWLTHLPLKEGRPPVFLHDGRRKSNQDAHFAVVDIDIGNGDLQQCADAVIRLRGEFLYSVGDYPAIHFNFTSGHRADFTRWAAGYRPIVTDNRVRWTKRAKEDFSYRSFREYLNQVFAYAGSSSLSKELRKLSDVHHMRIGDVFIQGGFPGHAAIVVGMTVNQRTGRRLFLLAQSFMPAQNVYVLKNPANARLSPWYELDFGENLITLEWVFGKDDLKRFP